MGYPFLIDLAILKFFNLKIACGAFDFFFMGITDFHIWRWPIAVLIIILLWRGGAKARWMVLFALVTVAIIDPTVYYLWKPLFARLRPCHEAALAWLRTIDGCGGKYGFPSSHAANTFGMAMLIGSFYKSARYYLYPIAILVSLSRIYLGVHYPSDVLGGAVYGMLVAMIVIYLARHFAWKQVGRFISESGAVV